MTAQNDFLFEVDRVFSYSGGSMDALFGSAIVMAEREGLLWEKIIHDDSAEIVWQRRGYLTRQEIIISVRAIFSADGSANLKVTGGIPSKEKLREKILGKKSATSEMERESAYWDSFLADFEKEVHRTLGVLPSDMPTDEKRLRKYFLRKYFGVPGDKKREYVQNVLLFSLMLLYSLTVFVLSAVESGSLNDFSTETAVKYGAAFNFSIFQGEYFRLITGPFFHFGFIHLLLNWVYFGLIFFWFADRFGTLFLLFFLLGAAVFPFAAEYAFLSSSAVVSGGISSMVTALLGLILVITSGRLRGGFGVFVFLFLIGGLFVWLTGLLADVKRTDESLAVSHIGHLAGFLGGVFFGLFVSTLEGRRTFLNQNKLYGAAFACFILLFFSALFIVKGNHSPIYKVWEISGDVMEVRDSVMNTLLLFNDSTDDLRVIMHERAVETLKEQSKRLDEVNTSGVPEAVKQAVNKQNDFLRAEAGYFQALAEHIRGNSDEEKLNAAQRFRDSLYEVWVQ